MPVKYGSVCDIQSYCIKTDGLFWVVPGGARALAWVSNAEAGCVSNIGSYCVTTDGL